MLWLIGGTQESVEIAKAIAALSLPCLVTVTTEAAKRLYPHAPELQAISGRLDRTAMENLIQQWQIRAIVDASHPFATTVSGEAIAAATAYNIPYLRYERPPIAIPAQPRDQAIIELDSFATLLDGDYLEQQRVFLAVGCKALPLFEPWQRRSTLFARILPAVNSLEVALKAGFTPDRILALRPPISAQLEAALWQQWQISLVVTKASGKAGGEDTKRAVAAQLGIPLIIIARPAIAYPQKTSNLQAIITFCCQNSNQKNNHVRNDYPCD